MVSSVTVCAYDLPQADSLSWFVSCSGTGFTAHDAASTCQDVHILRTCYQTQATAIACNFDSTCKGHAHGR